MSIDESTKNKQEIIIKGLKFLFCKKICRLSGPVVRLYGAFWSLYVVKIAFYNVCSNDGFDGLLPVCGFLGAIRLRPAVWLF